MRKAVMTVLWVFVTGGWFVSCKSNDKRNEKATGQGGIYVDCRVWGDEDDSVITIRCQYHDGGPLGQTILLEKPAGVELDGELLTADSSKLSGYYYELQIPADSFIGKHILTFTGPDNKAYEESFIFQPFTLQDSLPGIMRRNDFFVQLTGLDSVGYLRVVVTDTSFASRNINMMDTIRNGELRLSEQQLKTLVNGPGWIDVYKEDEKQIKIGTSYRGVISLTYGIKRGYILAN